MIYFDTSFLVPLVLLEATSEDVAAFFEEPPEEVLAISHWTRVEFSSLLAREVRIGGLQQMAASAADAQFEHLSASFRVILPEIDDFEVAKRYLSRFETGLRAADALHLAVAANRQARQIYTLDKQLIRAGGILGLSVTDGNIVR